MEIAVLKDEKNELELKINNLTVVEILREYLNKDSAVEFAAWRRSHPSEPAVLRIETKGKTAKKALQDSIALIEKDSEKFLEEVKKI
ncbi:MAG: RpoL/Rpb11 RNA polymerase subunit family protein [Candidatus Pacearchaeota archaeon]